MKIWFYTVFISFSLIFFIASVKANAQFTEISFYATDSALVTADLYKVSNGAPTILLFHQSASSRGEYRTIAPKFKSIGFN